MYLINYHLYANAANMPQMMAEDTGAAELRNPVNYLRTEYQAEKNGRSCKKVNASKFSGANVTMRGQSRRAFGSI